MDEATENGGAVVPAFVIPRHQHSLFATSWKFRLALPQPAGLFAVQGTVVS